MGGKLKFTCLFFLILIVYAKIRFLDKLQETTCPPKNNFYWQGCFRNKPDTRAFIASNCVITINLVLFMGKHS
jgi:hypothetical protein